jgi:hypothetical protein
MLGTPSAVLAVLVVGVVVNGLLFYGGHSLRPTPTAAPSSSPPAQTEHTTTAELTTTEARTSAERTPRLFFRLITNVLVRLSDNSGTAPIWTPTSGQNGPRGNHFATLNIASPNHEFSEVATKEHAVLGVQTPYPRATAIRRPRGSLSPPRPP